MVCALMGAVVGIVSSTLLFILGFSWWLVLINYCVSGLVATIAMAAFLLVFQPGKGQLKYNPH